MATVYRKTFTKPLPANAEQFSRKGEHLARWKDGKGRSRTANVTTGKDGSERITVEATTYTAKYRDGSGHVVETATGCKSKDAALSVLKDLTSRAEKVRSGVLTSAEEAVPRSRADQPPEPDSTPTAVVIPIYESALTIWAQRPHLGGQ